MKLSQFVRQAPWVVVLLILLSIVLAVLPIVLFPESMPASQTFLASVGSIVLLVFALFSLIRDTYSAWQIVVALGIVAVVVVAGLLVWREIEESRAFVVTDHVRLRGGESMHYGDTAVLSVRAPAPRDRLLIVFEAREEPVLGSPCAPSSALLITGGRQGEHRARFGTRESIALGDEDRSIRLEAHLETEPGCVLTLQVREAVLDHE